MTDKLFKGALLLAAGGIAVKAVEAVKYYRLQMKEHEEILKESEED